MPVQDIQLTDSRNDILIENGDFVIADSDKNHIYLILKTFLGDWKQFGLAGCGLDYYIASAGMDSIIIRNMTVQLTNDGNKVISITPNPNIPNDYTIEAYRE